MNQSYPMPEKFRFTPQKLLEHISKAYAPGKKLYDIPNFSTSLYCDISTIAERDADELRERVVELATDPDHEPGDYPGSVLHLIGLLPGFGLAAHLGEAVLTVYLNELLSRFFWTGKTSYGKHVPRFRKRWKYFV